MKPLALLTTASLFVLLASPVQAAVSWTDTITAGNTQIKATHINQIRTQIDNILDGTSVLPNSGQWTDGAGGDLYYNGGDVGIGIANPGVKLDISGAFRATSTVQAGTGSGGVALSVNDGYGNANITFNHLSGKAEQTGNAARIEVNTDSTTNAVMDFELKDNLTSGVATSLNSIMRLQSGGNVGIGTLSPAAKLEVVGVIRASDVSAANGSTIIEGRYSGSNVINTLGSEYSSAATILGFGVRPKSGAAGYVSSAGNSSFVKGALRLNDELIFNNAPAATVAIGTDVAMTERMRVNSTGLRLPTARYLRFGSGNQLLYGDNGSAFYADSNNSTSTQMIFRDNEDTVYGRVYGDTNGANFGLLDGDGNWSYLANKDNYTAFRINNSEKMRITTAGNVGIGTTAPDTRLHTEATGVNVAHLDLKGATADTVLLLDSSDSTIASGSYFIDAKDGGTSKFSVRGDGWVTATKFIGDGSGLTGLSGDNLGDHIATTTLDMNDKRIDNLRQIRMQDYDDNTGGSDNKYRILARDGGHQFYNGGVVVGNYNDGTWTDLADGYLVVEGRVGIGKTAAAYPLDVVGDARVTGSMAVGAQGTMSSSRVMDIRENFSGDADYRQVYANGTITGTPTVNRSAYGGDFNLTNNRAGTANGSRGYGYGVRGYASNSTSLAKSYYNAGGSFEARNNSTNGISNLRGAYGQAYQNATSGTTDYAYGVEGLSRGRSNAGATSVVSNARGVQGSAYPYNSNMTSAMGTYGYVATNNSYSGNITTAYGARGLVNHDSDDGATMTTAYGGYFTTQKRSTAPNIGTAYGVYTSAAGGSTNYGLYSAAGKNYFAGNVGIGTTAPTSKLHVISDGYTVKFARNATQATQFINNSNGAEIESLSPTTNAKGLTLDSTNPSNAVATSGSNYIRFNVRGSEKMRVKDNGNVGIGTTSPTELLTLSGGAINIGNKFYVGENSNVDNGPDIRIVQRGLISTDNDLFLNIDATNTTTNSKFQIKKDSLTTAGTSIFTVNENGTVTATGAVTAPSFVGDGSGLTGVSGDNLGNHTATANLNINDRDILNVRELELKDYDDNTGGTDNKVRLLARDGAHMFYDGGVVVGGFANGTWTDVPSGRLIVKDRIQVLEGSATGSMTMKSYTGTAETGPSLQTGGANTLFLRPNGAGPIILQATGNGKVGIGEQSPADKLEVAGSIRARSSNPKIRLEENDTTDTNYQIKLNAGDLRFQRANDAFSTATDTMVMLDNGNVGIGTGSAAYKLVVSNAGAAGIEFGAGYSGTKNLIQSYNRSGASYSTLDFEGANYTWGIAGADKLVLDASGRMGIGTTTPTDKLTVSGDMRMSTGRSLRYGTGDQRIYGDNATALYADSNDSNTTQIIFRDKEDANYGRVYGSGNGANFGLLDGDAQWGIQMVKDNYTRFVINNSEKMRIETGGKVGIGTTAPNEKLEVNGNIRITGNAPKLRLKENDGTANQNFQFSMVAGELRIETNNDTFGSSSAKMTIENNGFVGIGYINPTDRLHVNGNIKASGQIRAATYCDQNGANCANNPFGNQISINGVEDVYGAFTTGTPTDTCDGDNTNAYTCPSSSNINCTDRVSGTITYACGKDNYSTCTSTTNSKRTIDCQHLQVYGSLTP